MSLGVTGEAKWIKSLCCRQTWEAGAVPIGVGSGQASWGSQSEEEGTAEKTSDPAAAELSVEGGSQGKGGGGVGEGHSTGFFGP